VAVMQDAQDALQRANAAGLCRTTRRQKQRTHTRPPPQAAACQRRSHGTM